MNLGIFDSSTIPVLEQVTNFTESRQSVLAGNIANLDTPGYRSRDLSVDEFQTRLREAIDAKEKQQHPVSAASIGADPDAAMKKVKESIKSILYHDDSDVSLEKQVLEMSKNQSMHNMAIAIMSSQFRVLDVAISERV